MPSKVERGQPSIRSGVMSWNPRPRVDTVSSRAWYTARSSSVGFQPGREKLRQGLELLGEDGMGPLKG
jgi:hypothetical protein